jgi:hypothetical protein
VEPDVQAIQSLAWGLGVAGTELGASQFWGAALAADLYHRSVPRDSEGEEEVTDWVRKCASEAGDDATSLDSSYLRAELHMSGPSSTPETTAPSGAVVDLGSLLNQLNEMIGVLPSTVKPQHCLIGATLRPPIDPFEPGTCVLFWPEAMAWFKCCVEEFEYPATLTRTVRQEKRGERRGTKRGVVVGFTFTAEAEFKESVFCVCACCEFRQSVQITADVGGQTIDMGSFEEDYVLWSDSTGTYRHSFGIRSEADANTTEAEEVVEGGTGSDPTGAAGQKRPHFIDGRDNYYADHGHWQPQQANGCYYYMEDRASIYVSWGSTFTATYRYRGEIWDICHDRIEEGPKYFTVELSGAAYFGQVSVDYDVYRSDAEGNKGEKLAGGTVIAYPQGLLSPSGWKPVADTRTGSGYP